jgi:hypothetical protein
MIVRGWSVELRGTSFVGVVTRVWTDETDDVQHAEVAGNGRRWSGPASRLQRIELQRATLVVCEVRR